MYASLFIALSISVDLNLPASFSFILSVSQAPSWPHLLPPPPFPKQHPRHLPHQFQYLHCTVHTLFSLSTMYLSLFEYLKYSHYWSSLNPQSVRKSKIVITPPHLSTRMCVCIWTNRWRTVIYHMFPLPCIIIIVTSSGSWLSAQNKSKNKKKKVKKGYEF